MLHVGLIGTGVIFDLHIQGYLNNPDVKIVALCNRTIEKAKEKIMKFKLDKQISIYSDYKEMLEKEEFDIIEILLPHNLHAEVVIHAAKKHIKVISVQKPMALTLEEADEMIQACSNSGSILSIYENFVFAPHIMKAKALLDEDYIGEISSIRIKVAIGGKGGWNVPKSADAWRKDPNQIGGSKNGSPILFDNGWHAFTLGYWFFNEKIEKIFAWTGNFTGIDAPAYVMWKCEENNEQLVPKYGNMEFVMMPDMKIPSNYYNTDEFIEIIASRGIMKINQGTSIGNVMTSSDIFAPIVLVRDGIVESYKEFELDWKYSFINATQHLIEVAKNNKEPILTGEQAKEILRFNLLAIKSAELGKEIHLNE